MVPERAAKKLLIQADVVLGVPASAAPKPAAYAESPSMTIASAPRMSKDSSVTALWYSLQLSFPIELYGPGGSPFRKDVNTC